MAIEDIKALTELKGLSEETRHYFQSRWRNALQTLLIHIEDKNFDMAKDEVFAMKDELRRMGL